MSEYLRITKDDWLRFLWSFALSDHMGDAGNSVHTFAERLGLPMPPDDCDFEDWIDWLKTQGIDAGVYSIKAVSRGAGETGR